MDHMKAFVNPLKRHAVTAVTVLAMAVATSFAQSSTRQNSPIPTALTPDQARLRIKSARKSFRKGRIDLAEETLRGLVTDQPENPVAKSELAFVLLKQRRFREAYDLAFQSVKIDPKNAYAFAVLGKVFLDSGDLQQAKILFANSLKLRTKEPLAWAGFGLIDFYENRIDDALEKLEIAAFIDSSEPDYFFSLGQIAARAEKYQEAATAYERFLLLAPSSDRERVQRIEGLIRFLKFLGGRTSIYDVDRGDGAVSFELVRDRPVVVVRVGNGKVPMKFVLDTGSGITVISQKAAKRLGLKPITKGGMARAIGGSGKFEIVYGFVRSMDIGDARVRNIPVYIREFHETSDEIDGYIGLSLISKFLTTVDYGSKRLSLVQKKSIDETSDADSPILPLRLTSSGFLSGEVHLEGIESPFNFIVDTGASVSVITPQVTALEELNSYLRDERMRVVGAAGVIEDVRSFILPKMTFGPHSVESVRAIELDLEIINEASGFRQTGILGGNFLKNYRITFDFQKSRVVFTPILPAS